MPTQLAQIGAVAKSQARTQQAAQPAANFQEQQAKDDSLKTQRVKETEKSGDSKIDPDADRRKERRQRRQKKQQMRSLEGDADRDQQNDGNSEEEEEELGRLIDMRA